MKVVKRISKRYYFRQVVACWLALYMFFGIPVQIAMANPNPGPDAHPSGWTTTSTGSAGTAGNTTTITAPNGSIFYWDNFDIGSNHIVNVLQGINDATLSKVNAADGMATGIFGRLHADGTFILINPRGVIFGADAYVSARNFIGSSLDIPDADFTNGIYQFSGGGIGEVANYGQISAEQVALIGRKVLNAGIIRSPNGYVLMAAGDRVFLGTEGSSVVVEVDAVTVPQNPPIDGIGYVINEGTIEASGGKIVLAAGDTFSRAIEGLDGMSVAVDGGIGRVGQFGILNADGVDGDGGSINLTAGEVVALGDGSVTTANAGTNGDGGDVIVYSPETALFWPDAKIEAKGGSESGSGGFVELSGKEYVEICGLVDTTAPYGVTGTFLIDPTNITISNDDSSPFMLWYNADGFFADRNTMTHYNPSNLDIDKLKIWLALTNVEVTTMTDAGMGIGDEGWIEVLEYIHYTSNHSLTLTADDYIQIDAHITNDGLGGLTLKAGTDIFINDNIYLNGGHFSAGSSSSTIYISTEEVTAGSITLLDNAILNRITGNGSQKLDATIGKLKVKGIDKQSSGVLRLGGTGGIELGGEYVQTFDGSMVFENPVIANRDDGDGAQTFRVGDGEGDFTATLWTKGITKTTEGDLTLGGGGGRSGYDYYGMFLYGNVEVQDGSLTITGDEHFQKFTAGGDLLASGNVTLEKPGRFAALDEEKLDKKLDGQQGGQYAAIICDGWLDQKVEAGYDGVYGDGTGTLTAQDWLMKTTPGDLYLLGGSDELAIYLKDTVSTHKGNLWIIGNGDVQIGGDLTTFGEGGCPGGTPCSGWETGGVLIYSHDGKIYTEGGDNDTLNVTIEGNSDHWDELGVYDISQYGPDYDGEELIPRAAIVIMSEADLRLGPSAELRAYGRYYDPEFIDGAWDVDDRAAINFLDYDGSFPPGTPRDQGVPFDLAIYVASKTGDVDVSSPVSIMSREPVLPLSEGDTLDIRPDYVCVPKGTMVIDAWNAVTFDGGVPDGFEDSLLNGRVGDRLEVCSRVSEWLQDAVGRLPYVFGGGPFPAGYNYVLRGAGADNPAIGDGAPAWVLESFEGPPAPLGQPRIPTIEGCPVETQAAAGEIGITAETIQVSIGKSLALNPDIQPCDACARLINAARILRDEDGSLMAATVQAFNALAPADAPFTPEMGASIAMTFEGAVEGSQYASVAEYIDAFVEYVTVLETGLGAPVGDSTAFAMEKYGAGIAENANIVTYIEARLAGL